ncbi:Gfo/Idh/MocA family protein [Arachidicoccus terrestris]|uniref:Gfo/Idh/MocA family protein n=1 Tax=Arachidicoccus terrestris TaxID=2875539 RepID=UPI001CC3487F|nr:Gfo/Idh/MocA family oxidoreductase [Arachidicoccus terrestris]UAY56686.1 Gfo/Idh/MocA family oxidoreductase [Arachidicoccus terrestris]
MADKIYNWGILGPGKIARKFASALEIPKHSRLYAVASRDQNRAKDFASEFNADKYYSDYISLIKDPKIDAVYIATPHAFHYELAKACLENNKPVLSEKPLTLDAEQTEKLLALCEKNQVFLMEALWTRFIPMTVSMLEKIHQGIIGDIQYIKADFGFPAPFNPAGRLFDPALGGGSLLDVGIYPLFLSTLLLGQPEKILASGRLSDSKIDLDCQAILQYAGNKTALIASSIHYQMPITAEITGTRGQIQIPCPWYKNHYYNLKTGNEDWEKVELPPLTNGFEFEIDEVVRCIEQERIQSPLWPVSSSLQLARLMDEIKRQLGVQYPKG